MPTLFEALSHALDKQRAGKLEEAAALYRATLRRYPDSADALHLLGLAEHQMGRSESAAVHLERAVALEPSIAPFHSHLGLALAALGRHMEAHASFDRALRLSPQDAEAHLNFGNLLQELGKYEEAAGHYRHAIALSPEWAEAHNNLGNALVGLGDPENGAASLKRAIELRPDYAEAWLNLARARKKRERLEEAGEAARKALALQPAMPEAWHTLAAVLSDADRFEEAEAAARKALALRPEFLDALHNLAGILRRAKRFAEAEETSRRALELAPDSVEGRNGLGCALAEQGRREEAQMQFLEALRMSPRTAESYYNLGGIYTEEGRAEDAAFLYRRAIGLDPGFAGAHWNLALTLLSQGRYAEGWKEYEWRWKIRAFRGARRHASTPLWDGSRLDGKTILLWAEQGLGDAIQFIRYARLVKAMGARVIVECPPRLRELFRAAHGVDEAIAVGEPLPLFHTQAPLLSLPGIFGTRLETIPAETPYLNLDGNLDPQPRREGPLRVGLVWAGNPEHPSDRRRSCPLEAFAPLAGLQDVEFFSLQRGPAALQKPPEGLRLTNLEREDGTILDSARAMQSLDLIVTVDTAMAHLAGALARPVWTLLCFAPDWRWARGGETTPWYRGMRLFRQGTEGNWRGMLEAVAEKISSILPENRPI